MHVVCAITRTMNLGRTPAEVQPANAWRRAVCATLVAAVSTLSLGCAELDSPESISDAGGQSGDVFTGQLDGSDAPNGDAGGTEGGVDAAASGKDAAFDSISSDSISSDSISSDGISSDSLSNDGLLADAAVLDAPSDPPDGAELDTNSTDSELADASSGDAVLADSGDGFINDSADTPDDDGQGAGNDVEVFDAGDSDTSATQPAPVTPTGWVVDLSPDAEQKGTPFDVTELPSAKFTDVTAKFGFDAKQVHAPCIATADFNGDGTEDFLVIVRSGTTASIRTRLLGKSKSTDVYSPFDTTSVQPNLGCAVADMDGDNHVDLIVGGHSGLAIYKGNGKGGFSDISAKWAPYIMTFDAFSVTPIDLDSDGDLDLFVGSGTGEPPCKSMNCAFTASDLVCEVKPPIPHTEKLQDRVLIQGDKLPMTDETKTWKVPGGGLQTVALPLDVDKDGDMDLVVGSDVGKMYVLHNQKGHFNEYSTEIGLHGYAGAMGWSVADFNHDGKADLVMADSGPPPVFMGIKPAAKKPAGFVDKGGAMGAWWPMWGASSWSPVTADFNHDGHDDVLLSVGVNLGKKWAEQLAASCGSDGPGVTYFPKMPSIDVLLESTPTGYKASRLESGEHSNFTIIEQRLIDLDGDGDLDVVQTRPGPPPATSSFVRILRNDLVKSGKSCRVIIQGKGANQDALGTVITAKIGGQLVTRWLNGGSYGATRIRRAHFGLGAASKATDVTIRWPDGKELKLGAVNAGETKTVIWK